MKGIELKNQSQWTLADDWKENPLLIIEERLELNLGLKRPNIDNSRLVD